MPQDEGSGFMRMYWLNSQLVGGQGKAIRTGWGAGLVALLVGWVGAVSDVLAAG